MKTYQLSETEKKIEQLTQTLKVVEISLSEDEYYQHFKPLLKTIREALNKVEGH